MENFKYTLTLTQPVDHGPDNLFIYWEKIIPILEDIHVWFAEEGLVKGIDYIRPEFHQIVFKNIDIWVMAQLKFG
jgi:hypothetical protein